MDSTTDEQRASATSIVEGSVDEHAGYLFRYARPRVRDEHLPENLRQETFLAALKTIDTFRAESSPQTWPVGILRRKIVDYFRKLSRHGEPKLLDVTDPTIDAMFDQKGR